MGKQNRHAATLREVSWEEARPAFMKVKPELAELIDERKPSKKYPLLQARYPYGSIILQDGVLHLPNDQGAVVPVTHPSIHDATRNRLSYSNFPLGLMTHNGIEVSREVAGRIFTLRFFLPGVIMGLWESLSSPKSPYYTQIWTATAGARFIFTLPKIQATVNYNRLKKDFNLPYQTPREISQQWHIFKHIANHPSFNYDWYQELYFFPTEWMLRDRNDVDWIKFHHFLLEEVWQLSEYARNARGHDVVWDFFASILSAKGYKPNPLHIDILKHMVAMVFEEFPGMRAAGKSEIAAPSRGLQDVLINSYNLKQYVPTIMHPYHFSIDDPEEIPVYYSYNVPNFLTSLPTFRNPSSTLNELLYLHDLMEQFLQEAISGHLKIENMRIIDTFKKIKFTFFHSDATGSYKDKILNTYEMPKEDNALVYLEAKYGKREFAESAHYVRGCIRVGKK